MSKFILFLFFFFLQFTGYSLPITKTFAKSIDEEIAEVSKQIADLEAAIAPLKKESTSLQSKITSAKAQIARTELQIKDLSLRLINKEADLEVQKLLLFERVRRLYKNSKKFTPFLLVFSSTENTSLLRQYNWYQSVISQDRSTIIKFTSDINLLNKQKTQLESDKIKLASLKKTLETRFGTLATEIKKAEDYKKELTARQQQLIAEKTAMFNTSVGDVSTSDDPASRADFNPGFSSLCRLFFRRPSPQRHESVWRLCPSQIRPICRADFKSLLW